MIRVFIGYDKVEERAYHVLSHSIIRRTNRPVSISPVALHQLSEVLTRPRDPKQSNEFAFSRWLVPWLCGYEGWAIFMDLDMLLRADLGEMWDLRDERYAVQVVKHDYVPKTEKKYLGAVQYPYNRKNWSSVMLINCGHPAMKTLTPEFVNEAHGLDLHQFNWLESDLIGEIPSVWNHLVGEYPPNGSAKLVHFTIAGPWFESGRGCEYEEEWLDALKGTLFIAEEK